MNTEPLFNALDEAIVQRVCSRRDALAKAARAGIGAAVLTSVPVAFGLSARSAFGQSLPSQVVEVLNFALTLEYLEDEYYRTGVAKAGLIPDNRKAIFQTISDHETAHVALLESVLGSAAIGKPQFDFTANGTFDPFNDYDTFLTLSQGFEDAGVRAYKGQAPVLKGLDVLTTALQIHSVEARHASMIRRLRGNKGWIVRDNTSVSALAPIYAGEDNTTQGGVPLSSTAAVTEAFDEPLTKQAVLDIASMFIAAG